MYHTSLRWYIRSLLLLFVCAALISPADAVVYKKKKSKKSGQVPAQQPVSEQPFLGETQSLEVFYTDSGALSLSVDAVGTVLNFESLQVDKPLRGLVKKAFLVAASSGFSGHQINDGEIRVDGLRVMWTNSTPNSIRSWNALADVTGLVKPRLDAAPAGRIAIEISEENSELIDGVILAVIFDVPDTGTDTDIALYFGAQNVNGDGFQIDLPRPAGSGGERAKLLLGVGISHGLQKSGKDNAYEADQFNLIAVNGQRVTTAAGGPDDGSPFQGALITVGGIDDKPANPPDAYARGNSLLSDDEYYDITQYVAPTDMKIIVTTENPSQAENIFFASFVADHSTTSTARNEPPVPAMAAGIVAAAVLTSTSSVNQVLLTASGDETGIGSPCEIKAKVMNNSTPVEAMDVQLKIISGPHAGAVSRARTDATGEATFLYKGVNTGKDVLVAVVMDGEVPIAGSNVLLHGWSEATINGFIDVEPGLCPSVVDPGLQDIVRVALLGTAFFDVQEVDVTSLYLEDSSPIQVQLADVGQPATGDCPCSDEGRDGFNDLVMQFRTSDLFASTVGEVINDQRQLKLTGVFQNGKRFDASNCVALTNTVDQPTELPDNILSPVQTESYDEPNQ